MKNKKAREKLMSRQQQLQAEQQAAAAKTPERMDVASKVKEEAENWKTNNDASPLPKSCPPVSNDSNSVLTANIPIPPNVPFKENIVVTIKVDKPELNVNEQLRCQIQNDTVLQRTPTPSRQSEVSAIKTPPVPPSRPPVSQVEKTQPSSLPVNTGSHKNNSIAGNKSAISRLPLPVVVPEDNIDSDTTPRRYVAL